MPFLDPKARARFDLERAQRAPRDLRATLHGHPALSRVGSPGDAPVDLRRLTDSLDDFECREAATAAALAADDPVALQRGLLLCNRMTFLANRLRDPIAYSGCDCMHAWDMIDALSGNDIALFRRYAELYPAEAKLGHPATRLLCNALTALGGRDPARVAAVAARLAAAKGSGAQKALWSALQGIIARDPAPVSASIATLTKLNARLQYPVIGVMRFIALRAHAIHSLARHLMPAGVFARVEAPRDPPWWPAFAALPEADPDAPLAVDLPPAYAGLPPLLRALPATVQPSAPPGPTR